MSGIRLCPPAHRGGFRRLAMLLGGWLALASTVSATALMAQRDANGNKIIYPEYTIKAAFLLNFTKYVYWPEEIFTDERSPIVIGILGRDPFGDVIDQTFAERSSHGRELKVRRLASAPAAKGCCHLIFVSREEKSLLPHLLHTLQDEPVLIVGEAERFLRDGGGINLLVNDEERVDFEINLDATEEAGLRLRSEFVLLARRVWHEKRWERQRP